MRFSWINLASFSLLLLSGLLWDGTLFASAEGDTESLSTYCEGYQYNTDQLFEDIFVEASVDSNIQIADMFSGNPQSPKVENLYLNIYKMLDESPRNEALQNTASQYQYTQNEMCAILGGALYLLTDTSEKTLSITELRELREEILETYEKEFEKSKREQEMFLDSYGKEIFANGDTSDSSFDLLYDLEVIEYLLFGESTYTTTGGGDLNFTSDEDDDPETDSEEAEETTGTESSSGSASSSSGSSGEDETDGSSESDDSTEDSADDEEETAFDPAACVADSALQSSLEEVLETEDTPEDSAGDSEEGGDEGGDGGGGVSDPSTDGETDSGGSGTSGSDSSEDELILASTPHDWTEPDVCDGVFCLFINFINEDETDYETSDNCIQCHVDYILEAMRETTGKDLTPGKVSGNLLEPAVCKRSLVEKLIRPAGLTFIAIPMPIATPPSDDIVTNVDLCEKNQELVDGATTNDRLVSAIFKENCSADGETPDSLTEEENAALQAFGEGLNEEIKAANTRAYGAASVQDLFSEAIPADEDNERAMEETFQNSRIEAQFSDQATFYALMEQEMAQMNAYFQIFQDLIGNTQSIAETLKTTIENAK